MNASPFIISAGCAIEHEGHILLIQRPTWATAPGLLAFPGGKMDVTDGMNTDALHATARRETREEVGIHLEAPLHYISSHAFLNPQGHPCVFVLFHTRLQGPRPPVILSPQEASAYFWMAPSEILATENAAWLQHYILALMKMSLHN